MKMLVKCGGLRFEDHLFEEHRKGCLETSSSKSNLKKEECKVILLKKVNYRR